LSYHLVMLTEELQAFFDGADPDTP
jgi:hypothetical protein